MTKIYEANNHILIRAEYANPAEHCHNASHIIISLGADMTITAEGNEYCCQGVMIPSDVPHSIDTHNSPAVVFLYDCATDVSKQISSVRVIPNKDCAEIARLYAVFEANATSDNYSRLNEYILNKLGLSCPAHCINDDRIISAIQYIRSTLCEKLSCQQVADYVHLSQSRFSHLFKEQVGMTFASFLIYQRLMYVYREVFSGRSITDAALDAGFSSSAHFADINRRVFGISASSISHNISFTKIE